MTHEDRGHYAKKHPPDRTVKPGLADTLKKTITEDGITCAAAHKVAADAGEPPAEVGVALDFLETPITKCQLGLFGYRPKKKIVEPAENVDPETEAAIRRHLANDRLPCASAWKIAEELGMNKIQVAAACEALRIKISPCQLGAF